MSRMIPVRQVSQRVHLGWGKPAVWFAPYVGVLGLALLTLRVESVGTDCSTVCLIVRGWLGYTVFFATLSLTAFVAAFELVIWMVRADALPRPPARSNH